MSSRIDTPRLVRIHYRLRSFSFAMLFVATGLHIYGKDYGPLAWFLLALLFLVYPRFQYWRARRAENPIKRALRQLLVDSVLLGMYAAAMQFSIWLSIVAVIGILSTNAINSGWRGSLRSVLGLMIGAVAGIVLFGFSPSLHTELAAAIFCVVGIILYVLATGKLVFDGNIELRNTRKRLRTVLDGVESGVITISESGIVESFNLSAERMFGYEAAEVVGRNVNMLMPEPFRSGHDGYLENYLRSGVRKVIGRKKEVVGRRKDGAMFHMALDVGEALLNDRRVFIGSVRDISTRKAEETELRIAAAAFESLEAMVVTDASGTILRVNQAFIANTGYTAEECIGRNTRMLKSDRHDAAFYQAMWRTLLTTGQWEGEIWDRKKSGEVYPKWLSISAVKDADGAVTHYVGTHQDITERKLAEQRIAELAYHDQLTGLPNRTLLLDRLKQVMTASARSESHVALLFIDMDNFKTLNDTLGHDQGDLLLKLVAQRLTKCVRAGDTVARLGGDEFVAVLADMGTSDQEAANRTEAVGEKVLAALSQDYQLDTAAYRSTASIGATLLKGNRTSIDDLLKQADLAMYKAKDAGRNKLRFFDPDMETALLERAALENDLHLAVQKRQFLLHYQPQVIGARRVTGAEVLVRWQHPGRGLLSPGEFIALAEETGLILPLGHWVIETACRQLAVWATRPETAHLTIAVNVSAQQFRDPGFVASVLDILGQTGADPNRLKLELTESILVANVEDIIGKMVALKGRGVGFSLDDFGTGYSSLSYLKRLPLDQLKIDQSFVRDILVDPNDAVIARTVVALADSFGLDVIAEGVETSAQRDFLAAGGCHAYQGNFFSEPVPVAAFEEFVRGG
jgi:diguanylate cyclase (GGDEF)-like protein/PAS domain S-box-containing protein